MFQSIQLKVFLSKNYNPLLLTWRQSVRESGDGGSGLFTEM